MNYCVKHKCDFSQAAIGGCPFCEKERPPDNIPQITDAIRISYLAAIKKIPEKEYRENIDKEISDYSDFIMSIIKSINNSNSYNA